MRFIKTSAIRRTAILLIAATGLAGCMTVGPDYRPPEAAVPDAWTEVLTAELTSDGPVTRQWWTLFNDPVLDEIIELTDSGNLDLKTAALRIEEFQLKTAIAGGARLPDIDATGSALWTRSSEETTPALPAGLDREGNFYSIGAGVSWELDVWGRIRRSIESSRAAYEGSIEDYRDARVLLFSSVASTYMEIRSLQERVRLAEANVALQVDTLEITELRSKAGLAPDLDVYRAQQNLGSTRAVIPQFRAAYTQAMNQLAILTGQPPGALHGLLARPAPIPAAPEAFDTGLPADLLRQRPDVRKAERMLASQHARIGIARADLYPTFSLPGTFALESPDSGGLSGGEALAYRFGPSLRWNLFSAGRVRNAVRVEEARTKQALLQYENTVLRALEEVESAMVGIVEERIRNRALQDSADAAAKSVELVDKLYRSGLTDFQNVLDSQRVLTAQQDALAESRGRLGRNCILLYRALGGGWQTSDAAN